MSLPPDYHMHTPLCRHATGQPTEYAARAIELGLREIGFSDHSPMERDGFDDWRMLHSQLPEYIQAVNTARERYPQLDIRLALEMDYLPGHEPWIERLTQAHPWDYLIGSVHYLDTWAIDSPFEREQWSKRLTFDVWQRYFELLAQAASSKLFNIIAHPDLCKKFGYVPSQDCGPMYRRFLEAARQAGVAVEINTAGLRKDCQEIYPSLQFLRIARELGVPITFGSDAHAPSEVGMDFARAVLLAKEAGFTECARFKARRMELVPL